MNNQRTRDRSALKQSRRNRRGWITMSAVVAVMLMLLLSPWSSDGAEVMGFQSNLPERKPDYWIHSDRGGQIEFGGILAVLPVGFTEQGGASVFGNVVQSSGLAKPLKLLVGTEFAFGIWPGQVQTHFPKPIEFRIWLNAADFPEGGEENLVFMMYDPIQGNWRNMPSEFDPGTYQIVAWVESFTPVPDDFPNWGGRTFFGLFFPDDDDMGDVLSTSGPSQVNTNANLRAGPGMNYEVVGYAPVGSEVEPVAISPGGTWLLLSDDNWIAARLVDGVPSLPTSTAIPSTPTAAAATPKPKPTNTRAASTNPTPVSNTGTNAKTKFITVTDGDLLDLDAGQPGSTGDPDLAIDFTGTEPSLILVNDAMISLPIEAFGRRELCAQVNLDRSILDIDPETRRTYACIETSEGNLVSISVRNSTGMTQTLRIIAAVWVNDTE